MIKKNPKVDVKLKYQRIFEIGLIISIFLVILAFRFFPKIETNSIPVITDQPLIGLIDIPITEEHKVPPAPPKPVIPIESPTDEDLVDIPINETDLIENATVPEPSLVSDEGEEDYGKLFIIVEEEPEIIGGIEEIQKNVVYPEIAVRAGVQGKVFLQVVVDKEGKVEQAKVVKGIGAGCDEAALKAVMQASFKPGKQRGKPVRVQLSIPISFKLN